MNITYATLDTCAAAVDAAVAVDVCRAFTSAAYTFGAGAARIFLADSAADALALRERFPGALVMGEVEGLPVPGFDLWNSPSEVAKLDLRGKTIIQRTSSGTQGIVRAARAGRLWAASFAVAEATARAIRRADPRQVTFVITGAAPPPEDARYGIEDRACADYIAALLYGEQPDPAPFLTWEPDLRAVHPIDALPEPLRSQFYADLPLCRAPNRFNFALAVRREAGLFIMEREEG